MRASDGSNDTRLHNPSQRDEFFYGYHEASQLDLGCHGSKMTTNALKCCMSVVIYVYVVIYDATSQLKY